MEYIAELSRSLISVMKTFGITDAVDIAVVSFIIYSVIKLVRETRAEQLVKGILILLLAYIVSFFLKLKMMLTLLDKIFQFGVIALLVVFQPELRNALEQIGRSNLGEYISFSSALEDKAAYTQKLKTAISVLAEAAGIFQKEKVGALVVLERRTKLGEIIETGTIINARPSVALLGNIFFNKAPLHDGAMILRDGQVYAAGCILPLTKNENVDIDLGTRHRAALGISENSDAVVVVVSEETGSISLAVSGVLKRNCTKDSLKLELENMLLPQATEEKKRKALLSHFRKAKKNGKDKDEV